MGKRAAAAAAAAAMALAAAGLLGAGCGGPKGPPYDHLSDYGYFTGDGSTQEPVAGVVPYDVNAVLFADFAAKRRFIVLPDGGTIDYDPDARWTFPVGTTIVKTFSYPYDMRAPDLGERLVETRLLVRTAAGWTPHTYIWNDDQTDAVREVAGARIPVTWIDLAGVMQSHEYRVPNTNQCFGCHGDPGVTNILGLRTRMLNRDFDYGAGPENQLDYMEALGMFSAPLPPAADRDALPDPFDPAAGTVDERARAYLEANCAHCHSAAGAAQSTGLFLNIETTNPVDFGVCRTPFSAGNGTGGRLFDVVPGMPDASIMVYRMETTDPDIHMPELPVQLVDPDGVALVRDWITGLTPPGCP
ncbi:MAG TPA: SO2930 family diheme c-type cytochrome [Myxococcota bacterium]|nr:SO2930 family diheme c-type cytochrome [Myxococcota bacterium]